MKPDEDFHAFPEVEHICKTHMRITQKVHGSNCQIYIYEEDGTKKLKVGTKNRWLSLDDDNYGVCKFVHDNAEFFLQFSLGHHYGEWAGKGINSGEGMKERMLFLFSNPARYEGITFHPNVTFVPEMYNGVLDQSQIEYWMTFLKANGSFIVPGFMNVEGIIAEINGKRYKKVFKKEESKWKMRDPSVIKNYAKIDYSHLLQPIRLEKLLSRDEKYTREYPQSIGSIVKDYIADLAKEDQFKGDPEEIDKMKSGCSRAVFMFVKEIMQE